MSIVRVSPLAMALPTVPVPVRRREKAAIPGARALDRQIATDAVAQREINERKGLNSLSEGAHTLRRLTRGLSSTLLNWVNGTLRPRSRSAFGLDFC